MKLTTAGLTAAAVAVGLVGSIAAYRGQAAHDPVTPLPASSPAADSSAWANGPADVDSDDANDEEFEDD